MVDAKSGTSGAGRATGKGKEHLLHAEATGPPVCHPVAHGPCRGPVSPQGASWPMALATTGTTPTRCTHARSPLQSRPRHRGECYVGRHMPEIEQGLVEANGGKPVAFSFTPHLLPMTRGVPRCRTPAWANAYRPC